MNGLTLVAWVVGLGVLWACYMVAVTIAEAGDASESDLPRLDELDAVGRRRNVEREP